MDEMLQSAMETKGCLFVCLLLVVSFGQSHGGGSSLKRSSFPPGFVFGTASASYQYEGLQPKEVEDQVFGILHSQRFTCHCYNVIAKTAERIAEGSNGDVAVDQYHRYKEDVGIMKHMGLDAYRFSISWSRILPKGKLSGGINKEGIAYYNNLINELLRNGQKPFATIFHWDLPQSLEEEYGGFLSPLVVKDFRDFAEICFKEFGDRVKHWITLNEPWTFSMSGYASGSMAPGRCSGWQKLNCTGGNSGTEPYLVAHHLLLSHSAAVKLYRDKYKKYQKGLIGTTLVSHWMLPLQNTTEDREAARNALDFMLGWFMDPLTTGEYPKSMRSYVGKRLPKFSKEESKSLKGSLDFLGLNYYTTYYASFKSPPNEIYASFLTDSRASLSGVRNGIPIGIQAASSWLYIYPKGLKDLLLYVKTKYNNPLVYITENGVDEFNNASLPLKQQLMDKYRIDFYEAHISYLYESIEAGAKVKGYFPWSLMDNFEWASGYTVRFGINYIDYEDGLKRYPKLSAGWFRNFLLN